MKNIAIISIWGPILRPIRETGGLTIGQTWSNLGVCQLANNEAILGSAYRTKMEPFEYLLYTFSVENFESKILSEF